MDLQTRALLQKKDLGDFEISLVKLGVNRLEDLAVLNNEDLKGMGMTTVQMRKFEQVVEESRAKVNALADVDVPNVPARRLSLSGGDSESMNSSEKERKGLRNTFSGFPFTHKKKGTAFLSQYDDAESFGSAERSFSDVKRVTGSTKRPVANVEYGGGYNKGGYDFASRDMFIDRTLNLDIRLNRRKEWDDYQSGLATTSSMAVLAMYRGHIGASVNWTRLNGGLASMNAQYNSVYHSADVTVQCPITNKDVKSHTVKATTRVRASVRQVFSLLLMHDTESLIERSASLDGTFVSGQVLRVVSPRSPDGSVEDYNFPSTPLCTLKRTCHNLPDVKQFRDFVYRDYYELRDFEGREVGVRSMLSTSIPETEVNNGKGFVRGTIYEGSGFVVAPLEDNVVELCCIMVANVETKGGFFGKSKQTKQLEAMVSVVDSLRIWIESRLRRYGELSNCEEVPPPATFGYQKAPMGIALSVNDKALSRLVTEGESPTLLAHRSPKNSPIKEVEELDVVNEIPAPAPEPPKKKPPRTASVRFSLPDDKTEVKKEEKKSSNSSAQLTKLLEEADKEEERKSSFASNAQSRRSVVLRAHYEQLKEDYDKLCKQLEEERQKSEEAMRVQAAPIQEPLKEENPSKSTTGKSNRGKSVKAKQLLAMEEEAMKEDARERGESAQGFSIEERYERMCVYLRNLLPQGVELEDIDMTLEEAEKRMKDALQTILNTEDEGQRMEAERLFERYDGVVRNHPDYKRREEMKWIKWEEDNKEKNESALKEMRNIVKEDYLTKTVADLEALGMKKLLAKRIVERKVFKVLYQSEEEICKTHAVAVLGYNIQGMDIIELRALYSRLPAEFSNDPDGKKTKWRENFRDKLDGMIKKEDAGNLPATEKRHKAYTNEEDKPKPKFGGGAPFGGGVPRGPRPAMAGLQAALAGKLGAARGPPPFGKPPPSSAEGEQSVPNVLKNRGGDFEKMFAGIAGGPRGPPKGLPASAESGDSAAPKEVPSVLKNRGGDFEKMFAGIAGGPRGPPPSNTGTEEPVAPKPVPNVLKNRGGDFEKMFAGISGGPRGPPAVARGPPAPRPQLGSDNIQSGVSKRDLTDQLEKNFVPAESGNTSLPPVPPKSAAASSPTNQKGSSEGSSSSAFNPDELSKLLESTFPSTTTISTGASRRNLVDEYDAPKTDDDWEKKLMSDLKKQFEC